jgi:hypothetical protein
MEITALDKLTLTALLGAATRSTSSPRCADCGGA